MLPETQCNDALVVKGATDFSIAAIMGRQSVCMDSPDKSSSPLSIGGGYQDDDIGSEDDDENAIIDVDENDDDYKIPAIRINTAIPSTQTSTSISQSAHQNTNGSTSSKNRIGRPTKSSLSSPVSSSTASDDERLSPDSVKTRPTLLGSCNCDELKPIQCHLETKDLWEKFHELGTEMIITKTGRESMDPLLLEQHLRTPLRFFPDSMLAQFAAHSESESASAVLLEKARQHLQMIGRAPYPELLLPQMYQRPNFAPLNLPGLWQNQLPPQLSAGFLSAAAFANAMGNRAQNILPTTTSAASHLPLQMPPNQMPVTQATSIIMPPSSSSSSDSSSPDLRVKNFARFSPYPLPNHHHQPKGQHSSSPTSTRNSPN